MADFDALLGKLVSHKHLAGEIKNGDATWVNVSGDTMTGSLVIDGSSDTNQLRVQANATQTSNILVVEDSNGTDYMAMSGTGEIGVGTTPSTLRTLNISKTFTSPATQAIGINNTVNITPTAGADANQHAGQITNIYGNTTNTISGLIGIGGFAYNNGANTVATTYGLSYGVGALSTGAITDAHVIEVQKYSPGAGVITNLVGVNIRDLAQATVTNSWGINIAASTGATGTNKYGFYANNISGATNNYTIYTNNGLNRFGDQIYIDGSQDVIQLLVQGNATQTANIFTVENSSGTDFLNVLPDSRLQLPAVDISDIAAETARVSTSARFTATVNNANNAFGLKQTINIYGAGNWTARTQAIGGEGFYYGSGTISNMNGLFFSGGLMSTGGATNFNAIRVESYGTGAGIMTNARGLYVGNMAAYNAPTNTYGVEIAASSTAVGTNKYGLFINDLSGATNNYSIVTNAGSIVFNEGGDATTDFRVESDTEGFMLYLDANGDTDGALYLGGTTNGIKVNKGGELRLLGTATVFDDVRVEPVVRGTAGAKTPSFTNWFGGLYLYEFDDALVASEKEIFFILQLPHSWKEGTTIHPHVHWSNKSTGTAGNVVRWGLEYSKAKIGGTFSSSPTTIYGTTIVGGGDITVQYEHMITEITDIDMTGDTLSTVLICRLFRNSSNAADTYTGIAGLLYVDFHIEIDSMGSKSEFTKDS